MRLATAAPALLAAACLLPLRAGEAPAPIPAAAAAATVSWRLPPAATAALLALYDRAVAVGLPEAKGATLVLGPVEVTVPAADQEDGQPDRSAPWRRQRLSFMGGSSRTEDGKAITTVEGLHLRLADGRWLLNLGALQRVDATHLIVAGATARELAPSALTAALSDKTGGGNQGEDAMFTALLVEADRPTVSAMMQAVRPYQRFLGPGAELAALHLLRLGIPEAEAMLALNGVVGQLPFYAMMKPGAGEGLQPIAFTPSDSGWLGSRLTNFDWEDWRKKNLATIRLGDSTAAAGDWLAAWFQSLLLDRRELAAAGLSAQAAAEGALALTAPARQLALRGLLDRLLARAALPTTAAKDADLATRMQSWEPSGEAGDGGDGEELPDAATIAQMPAEMQQIFLAKLARSKAWRPAESDLPALLALAEDLRAARWLDHGTPRCLGDNALRAIAGVIGFDPRLLLGRPLDAPWTDAERSATADGLRAWWQQLAGRPLAEGLAAAIARLPPAAMAQVLAARPEEARKPLFEAIAAAWTAHAPAADQADGLASVLALAGDQAAIVAAVRTWKIEGRLRPLLACWRDRHGDPAALDALLEEALAGPQADDGRSATLLNVLTQVLRSPSTARLQRLVVLAGSPPAEARLWALLAALSGNMSRSDEAWQAVRTLDGGGSRHAPHVQPGGAEEAPKNRTQVLPLALSAILLADRRTLGDGLVKLTSQGGNWVMLEVAGYRFHLNLRDETGPAPGVRRAGPPTVERPPLTALRVRDLAAIALHQTIWRYDLPEARTLPPLRPDPWAGLEQRESVAQALDTLFAEAARSALAAAQLPDVLPAALPANDTGMF